MLFDNVLINCLETFLRNSINSPNFYFAGVHEVDFEIEGIKAPIGPIRVNVFDISKIKIVDLKDGVVQQQMRFNGEILDPIIDL